MGEQYDDFVTLGKIIGFFGVRGWVKVYSDTEPRENIVGFKQWWLSEEIRNGSLKRNLTSTDRQSVKVTNGKRSGKNVVAKIAGIESREQAEPLIGKEIAVPRSLLPDIGDDEFYWTDLIGCEVVDLSGSVFGPVTRLFETGANDVVVVKDTRTDSGDDILIPWIRPTVITNVDLNNRRIEVDWDPSDLKV